MKETKTNNIVVRFDLVDWAVMLLAPLFDTVLVAFMFPELFSFLGISAVAFYGVQCAFEGFSYWCGMRRAARDIEKQLEGNVIWLT